MAKGNQTLVATDKCLTGIPNVQTKILDKAYEMVCQMRLMYGAKIRDWRRGKMKLIGSREEAVRKY
jgi:hypothetical protein